MHQQFTAYLHARERLAEQARLAEAERRRSRGAAAIRLQVRRAARAQRRH